MSNRPLIKTLSYWHTVITTGVFCSAFIAEITKKEDVTTLSNKTKNTIRSCALTDKVVKAIKHKLIELDLNQIWISKHSGISQARISNFLRKQSQLNLVNIQKIFNALDIDVEITWCKKHEKTD